LITLKNTLKDGNLPKFSFASDIIDYIEKKSPEFNKYLDKNANYDDVHYSIPMKLVTKKFGWVELDIETMNNDIESYEGWIGIYNGHLQIGK